MLTSNKDQFGFYTVGDFKTYSKLEAIEQHGKTKQPIAWDFNRAVFEKFNWTQEPPGSLEFWYAERARQIREKYDYIVVWYSGGVDSHNVLMSFVNNNIFVDEIAQFHNYQGDQGNKQGWFNNEVFSTSAPFTQNLIATNPIYKNTKHRLVDLSEIQVNLMSFEDNHWDYFYKVGNYLSPNALARGYIRDSVPDYKKLTDQGKTVCFIHGAEKPELYYQNNNWYVGFSDRIDNNVSVRTQMLNRPWEHDELFYWSPELPELISKQAHVVHKYMSQITIDAVDDYYISSGELNDTYGVPIKNVTPVLSVTINHNKFHLLTEGLNKLIYPHWIPGTIVAPKPTTLAYSPRDTWIFKSNAPNIGQDKYHYGLLELRKKVKSIDANLWWEYKYNPKVAPYTGGIKKFKNVYFLASITS